IVRPLIALLHAFRFGGGRSALGFLRVVAVAGVEGDHEQRSVEKRVHGEGFFDQLLSITGITSMRISSPTSPASPGSRMPARLGALISRMTCSVPRLLSMSSRKRELKPMVISSPW